VAQAALCVRCGAHHERMAVVHARHACMWPLQDELKGRHGRMGRAAGRRALAGRLCVLLLLLSLDATRPRRVSRTEP
jgi:hypothetical protein